MPDIAVPGALAITFLVVFCAGRTVAAGVMAHLERGFPGCSHGTPLPCREHAHPPDTATECRPYEEEGK